MMIEQWFLQEIEYRIKTRKRLVILDPTKTFGFLLPQLEQKGYVVIRTDPTLEEHWQTVKEELFLRTKAESDHKEDPVIFYITRSQSKLTFLFDYCFTHGCVDLSSPAEWLKNKIKIYTDLPVTKDNAWLWRAGKCSIGKDISWWKKVLQDLEDIISTSTELIVFLENPEEYLDFNGSDRFHLLEDRIFDILGQPYISKPSQTLADEVVKSLFDGLAKNKVPATLLEFYYDWGDWDTAHEVIDSYLSQYKLIETASPWSAHPDHCFEALDQKALQEITTNLHDKEWIKEKLIWIKTRINSTKASSFKPTWWQDVINLLEYESNQVSSIANLQQLIDFYTDHFSKIDRAIRNLYVSFLQDNEIIRPLQEYYEHLNHELLERWYSLAGDYKSDQGGYLGTLFSKPKNHIAVIVGDGLRYEIADSVACSLSRQFFVHKKVMLADIPSETEHNMSALFADGQELVALQSEREKRLVETSATKLSFQSLEKVTKKNVTTDSIVLSYKDIDTLGESMQLDSIKLFAEIEQDLKSKIVKLLQFGYREVHLITDHGFVLTGLLTDADKIEGNATGKKEVHERFIRTVDKQNRADWIEFERPKGEFRYVYVAKNHRPFKTPGVYGYSHGGFTPQEVILPNFVFSKKTNQLPSLGVMISNKNDLKEVTGENFSIQLEAEDSAKTLFSTKRSITTILFSNNQEIARSNIISIEAGATESVHFTFQNKQEINAVLLDAETQEQLDSMTIKKSKARDFGGLI